MSPRTVVFAVLLAVGLAGCGDPQSVALRKLTGKGYSLSVDEFLRAARAGDAEALRWFVQAGVDPNVPDQRKRTGLLEAAKSGKLPAVQELVDLGAALPREGLAGAGLLSTAVEAHSLPVVKYLLGRGVTGKGLEPAAAPPCLTAARLGEREALELLLPLHPGSEQRALFAAASGTGDVACLSMLIRAGASVLVRDATTGGTALLMAASAGRQAAMELLISSGANRCVEDNQGRTALDLALASGHADAAAPLQAQPTKEEQEIGPLPGRASKAGADAVPPGNALVRPLKGAVFTVNSAFRHSVPDLFTLRGCREETVPVMFTGMQEGRAMFRLLPGGEKVPVDQGQEIGRSGWLLDAVRVASDDQPPAWWLPQVSIRRHQGNERLALVPRLPGRSGRIVAVLEFGPARDLYEALPGDTFEIQSEVARRFTVDRVFTLGVALHDNAQPEMQVNIK